MDFKELSYVLALARHQSVTKAAQELSYNIIRSKI